MVVLKSPGPSPRAISKERRPFAPSLPQARTTSRAVSPVRQSAAVASPMLGGVDTAHRQHMQQQSQQQSSAVPPPTLHQQQQQLRPLPLSSPMQMHRGASLGESSRFVFNQDLTNAEQQSHLSGQSLIRTQRDVILPAPTAESSVVSTARGRCPDAEGVSLAESSMMVQSRVGSRLPAKPLEGSTKVIASYAASMPALESAATTASETRLDAGGISLADHDILLQSAVGSPAPSAQRFIRQTPSPTPRDPSLMANTCSSRAWWEVLAQSRQSRRDQEPCAEPGTI